MNSNNKQRCIFTDKKQLKVIRYFYSKLSKQDNQRKFRKSFQNKEQKSKENSKTSNIASQNKIPKKYITPNEMTSKEIKKISLKNILNKTKTTQIKEIIDKNLSKNVDSNYISISSKNNMKSEDNHLYNIINNIENNSNIHIGSNNKITIIKNIFNRPSKSKNEKCQLNEGH